MREIQQFFVLLLSKSIFPGPQTRKDLKEFISSYYSQVFSAVTRLTGLNNQEEADVLTREILHDLWERKAALDVETRKGVFIYKTVLAHVLGYLKARGEEEKIGFLQKILPISPANYSQLGEAPMPDDKP